MTVLATESEFFVFLPQIVRGEIRTGKKIFSLQSIFINMETNFSRLIVYIIISVAIFIVSAIILLVRRLSLNSESKETEKVLGYFGHTDMLHFEISQKEENGLVTKDELFKPIELYHFLKQKYKEPNKWKGQEFELAKTVKETTYSENVIIPEYKEISYRGLRIKCPVNWTSEVSDKKDYDILADSDTYPLIKCKNDNGVSFSLKLETTAEEPDDYIYSYITEIRSFGKKFIHSVCEPFDVHNESAYSCGYGYKMNGANIYGMVLAYSIDSKHNLVFNSNCQEDWSIMCSEFFRTIIESIDYKYGVYN